MIGASALGIAMAYTAIAAAAAHHELTSAAGYIEAGIALGSAAAGVIVDHVSGTAGFAVSGGMLALVAVVTFLAAKATDADPIASPAGTGSAHHSAPSGR